MMPAMSERRKDLLSFGVGLVLTVATLFLITVWDFQPADIAVAIVFALGVAVGGVGDARVARHRAAIVSCHWGGGV